MNAKNSITPDAVRLNLLREIEREDPKWVGAKDHAQEIAAALQKPDAWTDVAGTIRRAIFGSGPFSNEDAAISVRAGWKTSSAELVRSQRSYEEIVARTRKLLQGVPREPTLKDVIAIAEKVAAAYTQRQPRCSAAAR
jgi:hypothetical protein